MKKIISFLGLFVLMTIVLTGCGKQEQVNKQNNDSEFRRPDFGQPERMPDVMGLVKSVVGNQVTILKINRATDEERAARQKEAQESGEAKSAPSIGGSSSGMHGMGMRSRPGSANRSEAEMLEMMKSRSEDEVVVTVPVGIRMLKTDTDNMEKGKPVMLEGTLEDVKQDKMISIWLNNDITDRKIADFVLFR